MNICCEGRRNRLIQMVALLLAGSVLTGCRSLGPGKIQERVNYNLIIQSTNAEQLLLNLVRLQYRDAPYFLEVSSVSSQFQFQAFVGGNVTLTESSPNAYGLNSNLTYSEKPTVTYLPLKGRDFVNRLHSPVRLETIFLLYHSGWSAERLLLLCVRRMNGIKNAPSASGPTPSYVPTHKEFAHVVEILRQMQIVDGVDFIYEVKGENTQMELLISDEAVDSANAQELVKILKLAPNKKRYPIIQTRSINDPNVLSIQTRSLSGVLYYLSQAVEVPDRDRQRGKVTTTLDKKGQPFDWREVTGKLIRIHSQSGRPDDAAVGVRYRGSWFYIDDSDLNSKSTFSLLEQLLAIQAGNVESLRPVLTLPVGG